MNVEDLKKFNAADAISEKTLSKLLIADAGNELDFQMKRLAGSIPPDIYIKWLETGDPKEVNVYLHQIHIHKMKEIGLVVSKSVYEQVYHTKEPKSNRTKK